MPGRLKIINYCGNKSSTPLKPEKYIQALRNIHPVFCAVKHSEMSWFQYRTEAFENPDEHFLTLFLELVHLNFSGFLQPCFIRGRDTQYTMNTTILERFSDNNWKKFPINGKTPFKFVNVIYKIY